MQRPLKIAHIFQSLDHKKLGGVGTFFQTFIRYLDKERTENFVIAYEDAPDRQVFEEMGISVCSRLQQKSVPPENIVEITQWLIRVLSQIQPDIVQTHVWHGDTLGRLAASHVQVPVIICRENNVAELLDHRHCSAKRRLARITDHIICSSHAVKQSVCEIEEIPEHLITIIYNGLPLSEYAFTPTQPTNQFVFVGRLEPQKAPLNLLAAFTIIAQEYPDCTLTIIGDGSLKFDCQCYVKEIGLGDRVHFLGYHTKPWQYASPGSIFVHHCEFEAFGLAITEAMASGHLCVLPQIGGVPEVAKAGTEAIFYEGNCNSLVTAMKSALEMPIHQQLRMIQAARTRVEQDFDAHRMSKQYLDLYYKLCAKKTSCLSTSSLDPQEPELNILNKTNFNGQIKADNIHSSIIFYSLAKSGSTFAVSLLQQLLQDVGIQWITLGNFSWKIRLQNDYDPEEINSLFKPYGYCYGCIRDPRNWSLPGISSYRKLLILRDPRDVLTSSYFSFGMSHKIPRNNPIHRKEMLKIKVEALRTEIDNYVVKVMPRYIESYQYYIHNLIGKPNVVLLRYEQMVGDFDLWLDTLVTELKLDVNPHLIDKIKREADFTVEKEDIYAHKRQVAPGDHRRKLKPETIEVLNAGFAEILDVLGYPI